MCKEDDVDDDDDDDDDDESTVCISFDVFFATFLDALVCCSDLLSASSPFSSARFLVEDFFVIELLVSRTLVFLADDLCLPSSTSISSSSSDCNPSMCLLLIISKPTKRSRRSYSRCSAISKSTPPSLVSFTSTIRKSGL